MPNDSGPLSKRVDPKVMRQIEAKLGLPPFRNSDLLIQALTHWSYVRDVVSTMEHNEGFEFYGDQVLGRSFEQYYRMVRHAAPYGLLRQVALSNGFIGIYAQRLGILHVALFSPVFKRNLLAGESGPSARLVAADLFEAVCYALWRDQGFPRMHEYASQVLWQHAVSIPAHCVEAVREHRALKIPIDGLGITDIGIPRADRKFTRLGFPNVVLTHIVSATLPDGTVVYAKADSPEGAYSQLKQKLHDGFPRSPHDET